MNRVIVGIVLAAAFVAALVTVTIQLKQLAGSGEGDAAGGEADDAPAGPAINVSAMAATRARAGVRLFFLIPPDTCRPAR